MSARIEAGISREEVAQAMTEAGQPIKVPTVENWEQGRAMPPAKRWPALAKILSKPISYFYAEEEAAAEDPTVAALRELEVIRRRLEDGNQQSPPVPAPPSHPGVSALAADPDLCRDLAVTQAELDYLARLYIQGPGGQPLVIRTKLDAVQWLQRIRGSSEATPAELARLQR
jgi:transcriptional regulator with XRE-family HTH domain